MAGLIFFKTNKLEGMKTFLWDFVREKKDG